MRDSRYYLKKKFRFSERKKERDTDRRCSRAELISHDVSLELLISSVPNGEKESKRD